MHSMPFSIYVHLPYQHLSLNPHKLFQSLPFSINSYFIQSFTAFVLPQVPNPLVAVTNEWCMVEQRVLKFLILSVCYIMTSK